MRPCVPRMDFNPRFPRGKRRWLLRPCFPKLSISIHASRGGSDVSLPTVLWSACNFNPRFPRGKRPTAIIGLGVFSQFQSTLPAGEATLLPGLCMFWKTISIHASRGGSDPALSLAVHRRPEDFNPRFPRGKRPLIACFIVVVFGFQSTLPAGEATCRKV